MIFKPLKSVHGWGCEGMSDGSWRTISAKWTFDYRTCYARWKQKQAMSLRQSALMRMPDDTWNGPVHACAALFYEFSVERELNLPQSPPNSRQFSNLVSLLSLRLIQSPRQ